MMTKREIRKSVREYFRQLPTPDRDRLSEMVCDSLYQTFLATAEPMRVGLFMSMRDEVQTAPLLRMLADGGDRHRLLVPRCDDEETIRLYPLDPATLRHSHYGIAEPTCPIEEAEVPDLLIVPGVAFGLRDGGRVGRGKGYYDRYLAAHDGEISLTIGIGLSSQLFDDVPCDPHDYHLDMLLWESGMKRFH